MFPSIRLSPPGGAVAIATLAIALSTLSMTSGQAAAPESDNGRPRTTSNFCESTTTASQSVTIPASGPASPYPLTILLSGFGGYEITSVSMTFSNGSTGLEHGNPDDLDILLVGPDGDKVLILSDAGGSTDASGPLAFDDFGPQAPDNGALGDGPYRPTNHGPGDSFPSPAPAGPYATSFGAFTGSNPNGPWKLFVVDDKSANGGSISRWNLNIDVACPSCEGQEATIIGTAASETVNGTPQGDVIVAGGGNDIVNGKGGKDVICAGGGNDTVNAGDGDDTVNGGAGNDTIRGDPGNDLLRGSSGRDVLFGGAGADVCNGGTNPPTQPDAADCESIAGVP